MKYDLNGRPNRFAQRTLAAFSGALMRLLETKPFEKITVNEICEACNYPRATFYNYFDDSYDLLNYCWFSLMGEINAADYSGIAPEERIYTVFERTYDYLDAHRAELLRICEANPLDGAFFASCGLFMRQQAAKIMSECPCTQRYPLPYKLVAEHYSNTLQLVIEWSFLRKNSVSRQEAESYLRYLLKNV